MEGLFDSTDARFVDANFIFIRYCSSDAYAGNVTASWGNFEFRGTVIAHSIIADLITAQGLGSLPDTQVMYGGCSAGARGALFNGDAVHEQLKAALGSNLVRYGVLFDSGFYIDIPPYDSSLLSLAKGTQLAVELAGMAAIAPPACAAAYPGAEVWKCFFGQYALPFLQAPFYANAFKDDLYQLQKNGIPGRPKGDQIAYEENFRSLTASEMRKAFDKASDAAVSLPGCHKHCNTLKGSTWATLDVSGVSLQTAVAEWFFRDDVKQDPHRWLEDTCSGWACGPGCP